MTRRPGKLLDSSVVDLCFFNEFLQKSGFLVPLLIIGLLVLSILIGYAYDVHDRDRVVD